MGADFGKMVTDCFPVFDPERYSNLETPENIIDELSEGIRLMILQQQTQDNNAIRAKARAFRHKKAGSKSAAVTAMKEHHQYARLSAQISKQKMVLEQVRSHIETAVITKDIAGVLGKCTVAISGMMKGVDVTDVDKMMETLQQQTDNINEISQAVSTPLETVEDVETPMLTEDDLWRELELMDSLPPEFEQAEEAIPVASSAANMSEDSFRPTISVLDAAPYPPVHSIDTQADLPRRSVDLRRSPSTRGSARHHHSYPKRQRHPNRLRPRNDADRAPRAAGMGTTCMTSGTDELGTPVGVAFSTVGPQRSRMLQYKELELT